MKKLILTGAFILITASISFSQKLSFGVRDGVNVANLSMTFPSNLSPAGNKKKSRTSINMGAYGQYALNTKMTLQAELFYSGEGASFTDPGTESPEHIKLSFLSLPVFFKYTIVRNFYAMAGPQFSRLLAAHSIFKDGASYNVAGEHKQLAIGVVPAVGYDWKNFSVSVRYQVGLSKLPKTQSYWSYSRYSNNNVKSNVLSVVVAYRILK